MTSAREIMHFGADSIVESDSLAVAAQKMRDLHIGALPICDAENRLQGIITDRDIVVRCIAAGRDPKKTSAGELTRGTPVWVDASASAEEVLRLMTQYRIRRVPVMENDRLVGMISEADLATHLNEHDVSEFASRISSSPPNS